MTEIQLDLNSEQFSNIQTAVASHFAETGRQVFICNVTIFSMDDGDTLAFVDCSVLDGGPVTVTVDFNLTVSEA